MHTNENHRKGNDSYESFKDLIIECKIDYQFFDKQEKKIYSSSKINFYCDNRSDEDEQENFNITYEVYSDIVGNLEKNSSSRSSFTTISYLSDYFAESKISNFDSSDAIKKQIGEKEFISNKCLLY